MNTKPQLQIYADDVKCAHGATIGCLDENALFYLRSRGIAEDEARAMLVKAFINEVSGIWDRGSVNIKTDPRSQITDHRLQNRWIA